MLRLVRQLTNNTAIRLTQKQWERAENLILEELHDLDTAKTIQWMDMRSERDDALADTMKMSKAIHDAINKPKGVVPKSANAYYDQDYYARHYSA